jgi:hypothetical protein
MKVAALLAFGLIVTSIPAYAQQRTHGRNDGVIRFQPKLAVGSEAPKLYERHTVTSRFSPQARSDQPTAARADDTEIVCGMKVIRKTHDADPKIVFKPKLTVNPAVRKITPPVCSAPK